MNDIDPNTDAGFAEALKRAAASTNDEQAPAEERTSRDESRVSNEQLVRELASADSDPVRIEDGLTYDEKTNADRAAERAQTQREYEAAVQWLDKDQSYQAFLARKQQERVQQTEDRAASVELAARGFREAYEEGGSEEEMIGAALALKNTGGVEALDYELDNVWAQETEHLSLDDLADLSEGSLEPEDLNLLDIDQIRHNVEVSEKETALAETALRQALVEVQLADVWKDAYTDSVARAGKELGLKPEQMHAYLDDAMRVGLLEDLPETPHEMLPQLKHAISTVIETEQAVHKNDVSTRIREEFMRGEMRNGFTYGNEPEEWVIDPATGLGRWQPVSHDRHTSYPQISEKRIAERAASRRESSMTKGEFRKAVAAADGPRVRDGFTDGSGRPISVSEAITASAS